MNPTNSSEVLVEKDKYLEILGFTCYAYIAGKITKYSGIAGGRTRTLGEFIENFVYGKVAEEAFKSFLARFGLQTLTELDVADFYQGTYLPDIVAVKRDDEIIPLRFWIDVKEVRRDQKWMLIPASSVRERPYDAYVAVWVGLPDEHVLWLMKNVRCIEEKMSEEWLRKASEIARNIEQIPCKICGYATWDEVFAIQQKRGGKLEVKGGYYFDGKTPVFDPEDPSWRGATVGENVGFYLKDLENGSDWVKLVRLIEKNERIVPRVPMPRTKSGELSKRSGLPPQFEGYDDYRNAFQEYLCQQLNSIRERFGKIERTRSWFAQSISEEKNK
jgi:hypothetical protein